MKRTFTCPQILRVRGITLASVGLVTALLSGCIVTSVSPFYTEKDLVSEPAIRGQWTKTDEPKEHWKFEDQGEKAYRVTYMTENQTNRMEGRCFKLQGQLFLDLSNAGADCDLLPPPIPSHLLLRIYQVSPSLRMGALNHDWLKGRVTKDPKAVRHYLIRKGSESDDIRVVLTGETSELQHFVLEHLATGEAWTEPFELKRD